MKKYKKTTQKTNKICSSCNEIILDDYYQLNCKCKYCFNCLNNFLNYKSNILVTSLADYLKLYNTTDKYEQKLICHKHKKDFILLE